MSSVFSSFLISLLICYLKAQHGEAQQFHMKTVLLSSQNNRRPLSGLEVDSLNTSLKSFIGLLLQIQEIKLNESVPEEIVQHSK